MWWGTRRAFSLGRDSLKQQPSYWEKDTGAWQIKLYYHQGPSIYLNTAYVPTYNRGSHNLNAVSICENNHFLEFYLCLLVWQSVLHDCLALDVVVRHCGGYLKCRNNLGFYSNFCFFFFGFLKNYRIVMLIKKKKIAMFQLLGFVILYGDCIFEHVKIQSVNNDKIWHFFCRGRVNVSLNALYGMSAGIIFAKCRGEYKRQNVTHPSLVTHWGKKRAPVWAGFGVKVYIVHQSS